MNVYDFDDTIFRGDSTRAFWAYCLKRAPGLARFLPRQCAAAVRYALGRTAKEAFKEAFFSFLQGVPDADAWAEDFWRTHERRFRPWYLAHTALAVGIFLVLVGLAALSWVVTLIRVVREMIW